MTTKESQEILEVATKVGELTGGLQAFQRQIATEHSDNQAAFRDITQRLEESARRTETAAQELASNLGTYKQEQAKMFADLTAHGTNSAAATAKQFSQFVEDDHRLLTKRVESLEKDRIAAGAVENVLAQQRVQRRWLVTIAVTSVSGIVGMLFNLITNHHIL